MYYYINFGKVLIRTKNFLQPCVTYLMIKLQCLRYEKKTNKITTTKRTKYVKQTMHSCIFALEPCHVQILRIRYIINKASGEWVMRRKLAAAAITTAAAAAVAAAFTATAAAAAT